MRRRHTHSCLVGLVITVAVACSVAPGCRSTGPKSIRAGRGNYNIAIAQTNSQQLLLNLVRLRYRDTPVFLAVTSVSTSYTVTANVGATVGDIAELGVVGVEGGLVYAERPTITYAPLQGQQFVDQLMQPISLRAILLLYHSSWRIDRLFTVCFQSLGGLPNAPSAASPTPSEPPEYEDFHNVVAHLRTLQKQRLIEIGLGDDEHSIVIQVLPRASERPEIRAIVEEIVLALELPEGTTRWTLTTDGGGRKSGSVPVVTRSLAGSMYFLSQGVQAPASDEQAGRVTVTRDERGQRFDWNAVLKGLFKIMSSDDPPKNAYSGIAYRDSWFYIDDSDLETKSTFSLLTQLAALQAGDDELQMPTLTLPVR